MKQDGSRLVLHPADVKGKWMTWRRAVFAVLIAFYVLAPFVPVGGHPMIQLDVQHRAFYLFGQTFNPQDFWMVLLFALSFAFGLLFVTAWRGRVWCGWACPQTVFLEGVYRPIERFFDGPRESRIRLDAAPWSLKKVARRVGKYTAFLLVSLGIAHTAAALFVSPKELWLM
ncbi:MAG TPA: 4Fe-4S binding protein, partial [Archangium sp.]